METNRNWRDLAFSMNNQDAVTYVKSLVISWPTKQVNGMKENRVLGEVMCGPQRGGRPRNVG